MRSKFTAGFILVITIGSCRKSNYAPTTPSPASDSLFNWTVVGAVPGKQPEDIWFTSASNGFIVGDVLYQTLDGGSNWSTSSNISGIGNFFNLFFSDPQHGFAETPSQLATTADGGNSWKVMNLPTSSGQTIFFVNAAEGYYGDNGGGGLMKSIDSGKTWANIYKDAGNAQGYYPFFINRDTGFVATAAGTFASTFDGGINWQANKGILPANSSSQAYSQLFFMNRNVGFYGYPQGILKTIDGGQSWQNVLPGTVDIINGISVIHFVDAMTGYYKGASVIYKSSDGGQTWAVNCRLGNDHFVAMYILDNHTGWALTDAGRILKTQQ